GEMAGKLDEERFLAFLQRFCADHKEQIGEDDPLPFKLVTYYLLEVEARAECMDWAIQYLEKSECPVGLASHIAHSVAEDILNTDLSRHIEADSDPPQLKADSLARDVFNKVHEVCNRWSQSLPVFNQSERQLEVSTYYIKNTRRKMEDRHVVLPDLNSLFGFKDAVDQSYFAVFDGHGGVDASVYAATHLHHNIVNHPNFNDDLETAMRHGFTDTDAKFVAKAARESIRSGSTGVCTILRDGTLHVAWLGDSQAMLVKNGSQFTLMEPHKPEREDEKKRIEELGGCVVWYGAWRVNGSLSVSRAIGDADHKPYISGEPDYASFPIGGSDDYIVLACDGLWDTVTPNDLVHIVHEHIKETNDYNSVAKKLVETARDNGSNDNITVVVVFLRRDIGTPSGGEAEKEAEGQQKDSGDHNSAAPPDNSQGEDQGNTDQSGGSNINQSGDSNTHNTQMNSNNSLQYNTVSKELNSTLLLHANTSETDGNNNFPSKPKNRNNFHHYGGTNHNFDSSHFELGAMDSAITSINNRPPIGRVGNHKIKLPKITSSSSRPDGGVELFGGIMAHKVTLGSREESNRVAMNNNINSRPQDCATTTTTAKLDLNPPLRKYSGNAPLNKDDLSSHTPLPDIQTTEATSTIYGSRSPELFVHQEAKKSFRPRKSRLFRI
ncbi:unnamed protein product, partial [Owenia fusiformis]